MAGHAPTWLEICLHNRDMAIASKQVFGGWRRAMVAIGLSDAETSLRKIWSTQRVIDAIRRRQSEGKPLDKKSMRQEDNALICAARKHFGSWQAALTAAGCKMADRPLET